jgi:adenine-specific DNA-methyltransferase
MAVKIAEGRILFPAAADGRPMLKRFKSEAKSETVPVSTWIVSKESERISNSLLAPPNTMATRELQELFGAKLFPHPKSTQLIAALASQCGLGDGDILLDFFAGSATTADAVMQMNAQDGGRRRYILVQLPEPCPEDSEAFRAGFATIAEIGKERIRRAAKKIRETGSKVDLGFRTLKIDTSNLADVFYAPDELKRASLDLFVDNVKSDRSGEDLLFQVLLDWGVDLSLPVEKQSIRGKDIYLVDGNAVAACFDAAGGVDEALVKEMAKLKPLRAVFRDAGFKSDDVKTNVEQVFKLLSPSTDVRTI